MQLTDTHTHIYIPELAEDIDGIIARANANSIDRFFLPNIDVDSVDAVYALAERFPGQCFPMMGLHPCSVKEDHRAQMEVITRSARTNRIYAIGEIGIDLYWDKTYLEEQKQVFRAQIHLAKELKLPIVIHCREAFDEIYELLLEEKDELLRGIFHCFTGTAGQAEKVIELGFLLGIGGVLTYKNAGLDQVLKNIGLEHLVLETDSPYLTPVPHRGKKNESSYLIYIAQKLADVKEMSLEQVAQQTTANSKKVFGV